MRPLCVLKKYRPLFLVYLKKLHCPGLPVLQVEKQKLHTNIFDNGVKKFLVQTHTKIFAVDLCGRIFTVTFSVEKIKIKISKNLRQWLQKYVHEKHTQMEIMSPITCFSCDLNTLLLTHN